MTQEKILITSQKLMGDLIVQTAAFASLRLAFPAARIVVLCERGISVALATNRDVDEIWGVPFAEAKNAGGVKGFWLKTKLFFAWAWRIRAFGFTRVLVTDYSDKACLWAFFSAAPIRGGLQHQSLSFLLNRRLKEREGSGDYIGFYVNLAVLIGGKSGVRKTSFPLPAENTAIELPVPDIRRPFFAIHPAASTAQKRWTAGNWAALIAAIFKQKPASRFVLVSGPGEAWLCEEIRNAIKTAKLRRQIIVCAERPLIETAAIMRAAELVFCLDSASRHLAAALRVPSISLLTKWILPTWGLYTAAQRQFVIAADVPRDIYDISSITVGQVMQLFNRVTRKAARRPRSRTVRY